MNMLEALTLVRQVAAQSPQLATKRGISALKVVDGKIQSLLRKKAWRDGGGSTPIHMGEDGFKYPVASVEEESLAEILTKRGALERELARVKASDEYNFALLKKCHAILGMADDQSYSLIPGEIEEWMCSHGLVKEKEVKATDRAVRLQQSLEKLSGERGRLQTDLGEEKLKRYGLEAEIAALTPPWKVGDMAILAVVGGPRWVKILSISALGQATTLAVKDCSVGYYHTNAFLDVAGYLKHCDRMRDEWTGKEYHEMQEKAREPVTFPANWEEALARASDQSSTQ